MKGLESLIPHKNESNQGGAREKDSVFLIDIEKIKPNPYQPRKEFKEKELKSLSESIKTYGVIQPLTVTRVGKDVPGGRSVEYELIAGERRLRAAQLANLPRVPAIVKHSNNKQKLEVSLIENIQRDDLNPLEEARAFLRLRDEFSIPQKEIAERVSKSPSYIANVMRILSLPEHMQEGLAKNEINEGHTRPLLSVKDSDKQENLYKEIVSQGLNVRQAEKRAQELLQKTKTSVAGLKTSRSGKTNVDPELLETVEKFKNTFNLSDVKIGTKGRKAHFAVSFSSKEDLRNWVENILSS